MTNESDADTAEPEVTVRTNLRHLTPEQFTTLGVSQMAYVKPVVVNGARAFAIHGADGSPMALAGDEAVAMAAIAQHEMVAAYVQ